MSKIGIVVAMDKEFALFEKLLDEKKDISSAGFKIMTGRMDNKKICLMTSGIGKVAAATGINLLRSLYQPDMVVNSGVAGGLGENLKTGDVIAGTEYVYHDVDCGPGNEYGQVQGFPARFKADARLLEAVSRQGIRSGLFCTGDQFISDPEQLKKIRKHFPEVQAVDMESAAMAQVCCIWNIPFLSLRIISDTPGRHEDNLGQYYDFWKQAPEQNYELLRSLIPEL